MSTVTKRVFITTEQRAHVLKLSQKDPGRVVERAVRLGFDFMHTPLQDFALFCHCLGGGLASMGEDAMETAMRLAPSPAGDPFDATLEQGFHDTAVKHFTAIDMPEDDGFSLCLWYGLLSYLCRLKSLREAVHSNYPKRSDDPMSKILNDGKTHAGQAFLAGTSDFRAHCETCAFMVPKGSKSDLGSCGKYAQMMPGIKPPMFPMYALACKFYEEASTNEK